MLGLTISDANNKASLIDLAQRDAEMPSLNHSYKWIFQKYFPQPEISLIEIDEGNELD